MITRPLHYLACPIAHANSEVIARRHSMVSDALIELMKRDWLVYSPMSQHYAIRDQFTHSWDFWIKPSLGMLDKCDVLMVLMLDGWRESVGVTAEIKHAVATHKTVLCVPNPLTWNGDELNVDSVKFNGLVNWDGRRW